MSVRGYPNVRHSLLVFLNEDIEERNEKIDIFGEIFCVLMPVPAISLNPLGQGEAVLGLFACVLYKWCFFLS